MRLARLRHCPSQGCALLFRVGSGRRRAAAARPRRPRPRPSVGPIPLADQGRFPTGEKRGPGGGALLPGSALHLDPRGRRFISTGGDSSPRPAAATRRRRRRLAQRRLARRRRRRMRLARLRHCPSQGCALLFRVGSGRRRAAAARPRRPRPRPSVGPIPLADQGRFPTGEKRGPGGGALPCPAAAHLRRRLFSSPAGGTGSDSPPRRTPAGGAAGVCPARPRRAGGPVAAFPLAGCASAVAARPAAASSEARPDAELAAALLPVGSISQAPMLRHHVGTVWTGTSGCVQVPGAWPPALASVLRAVWSAVMCFKGGAGRCGPHSPGDKVFAVPMMAKMDGDSELRERPVGAPGLRVGYPGLVAWPGGPRACRRRRSQREMKVPPPPG